MQVDIDMYISSWTTFLVLHGSAWYSIPIYKRSIFTYLEKQNPRWLHSFEWKFDNSITWYARPGLEHLQIHLYGLFGALHLGNTALSTGSLVRVEQDGMLTIALTKMVETLKKETDKNQFKNISLNWNIRADSTVLSIICLGVLSFANNFLVSLFSL